MKDFDMCHYCSYGTTCEHHADNQFPVCEERAIYGRLAAIEDILGPDYDLDRLRALMEADRDGLVRIARRPPLESECCGNCGHFRRITGTARGADAGEILLDALEYYGERAQVDMILEEMAELSKALLKLRRAQKFREPGQRLLMEDVAEEIADVQIVLDQMKLLFPGWETWMQKKLQRLEERIEKERTKGAVERRDAGDRAAAAGGDGPAVRRPPGDGGSGEAGPVQGESEAST